MRDDGQLETLRDQLSDALRHLPGATALYAFGSLVDGRADRYSDIDLEIVTVDLDAAIAARHAVWAQVGPLDLEWRISPSRSDFAATLQFRHASLYHKVDIGFTRHSDDGAAPPEGQHVILWRQDPPSSSPSSATPLTCAPGVGTPAHFVAGQLLGVTRYVKARKRGQHLTAYRFASALAHAVFALVAARQTGDATRLDQKLSTSDWLDLDDALPEDDRRVLLSDLDFSTPKRMDRTVHLLVRRMTNLLDAIPGGAWLPSSLTDRYDRFVREELGA